MSNVGGLTLGYNNNGSRRMLDFGDHITVVLDASVVGLLTDILQYLAHRDPSDGQITLVVPSANNIMDIEKDGMKMDLKEDGVRMDVDKDGVAMDVEEDGVAMNVD